MRVWISFWIYFFDKGLCNYGVYRGLVGGFIFPAGNN